MITVYTPNSQEELRRLDYRMKWEDDFRAYLKNWKKTGEFGVGVNKVPTVWECTDLIRVKQEMNLTDSNGF